MTTFGSLDGGEDGEYNGVGFVEISEIFVSQDAILFGREPLDRCLIHIPPGEVSVQSPSSA